MLEHLIKEKDSLAGGGKGSCTEWTGESLADREENTDKTNQVGWLMVITERKLNKTDINDLPS